jgi:hypothetical protein
MSVHRCVGSSERDHVDPDGKIIERVTRRRARPFTGIKRSHKGKDADDPSDPGIKRIGQIPIRGAGRCVDHCKFIGRSTRSTRNIARVGFRMIGISGDGDTRWEPRRTEKREGGTRISLSLTRKPGHRSCRNGKLVFGNQLIRNRT